MSKENLKVINQKDLLQAALNIAFEAHKDQIDKGGMPYILHPMRLMFQFSQKNLKIIALLHDVLEDSSFTENDLNNAGFSKEIINALIALTRKNEESYQEFIERIAINDLARLVKIADIKDNLDITRLSTLNDKDIERIKKYHSALVFLEKI